MYSLLTTFSPMTIILCTILIFLAFKSFWDYKRWMQSVADEAYKKRKDKEEAQNHIQELQTSLDNISEDLQGMKVSLNKLTTQVEILTESDKDDIKIPFEEDAKINMAQKIFNDMYDLSKQHFV